MILYNTKADFAVKASPYAKSAVLKMMMCEEKVDCHCAQKQSRFFGISTEWYFINLKKEKKIEIGEFNVYNN